MTFEEKVKFLRALPQFKVTPISEVRAIAFAAKEKNQPTSDDFILSRISKKSLLVLNPEDVRKILCAYPTLKIKTIPVRSRGLPPKHERI